MKLDSLHTETPLGSKLFQTLGGKHYFQRPKSMRQWNVSPRFYQQATSGNYGVEMKRNPRHDKYFGGALTK